MLTIKKTQANFLDRKAVTDAIGKARAGVLAKSGSYVRTVAKRSMRKKKGQAPPGQPPHEHQGDLDRHLYYAFDPGSGTVVVGSAKLQGVKGDAPGIQERGGPVQVRGVLDSRGKFTPLFALSNAGRRAVIAKGRVVVRTFIVEPRPYMGPALEVSRAKLASFWKDQVRR